MNLSSLVQIYANEGIPEEQGRGPSKYIEKVGTQWCIRSNGIDQNYGCWPDKAKAEAVMRGESFITPDVPKDLLAGGPGSGRKKEAQKEYQRIYKLAQQAGHNPDSAHKVATEFYLDKLKSAGDCDWITVRGHHICVSEGQDKGEAIKNHFAKFSKGLNNWKSRDVELKNARKDPKQRKLPLKAAGPPMIKFKNPSPYKKSEMGERKPAKMKPIKLKQHKFPNQPMLQANDWGEPNAGAYQHAHLDTNLWFHPPSQKRPERVPTDDPGEKNDKFLDVTKRKNAHKQRMDLLKKSTPGGTPPNVPIRTTLISPTLNSYLPMHASAARRRRRMGGGNFKAYGAAQL